MYAAHVYLLPWSLLRVATSVLVISAFFYMRGWLLLRNDFPYVIPIWRLASFVSGLVSVWTVVASPLAPLDHRSLTLHMVKHLLLMTVAAPLLLAGRPGLALLGFLSKHLVQTDVRNGPAQVLIHCRHSLV